ncbi:rod shape-determining protein RodA [Candidatus Saccharibacteria bacterium]|nr:rod shape-determining protein RodA [Candidatus Saccharibacteria bacterium]
MFGFRSRFAKNFDWILGAVAVILVVFGILVIYSTSFKATTQTGSGDAIHQTLFAVIGFVFMIAAARSDYRAWGKLTTWLYGLMIVLLIWVDVFSHAVLGATRWINFGFFQFQPSEFAKLVMIVVLARFFADNYDRLERPKYLFISLGYLVVPVLLVMKQPDLGTALVLVVIWLSMALVSRIRKLHLAILAVIALSMLPFGLKLLKPFQRARLDTFINPTADPLHTGYNAVQSTITVGSGQVFGQGLAAGSQSQLNFLPSLAQHTDFIFAVAAEKLGFVGAALLLVLFGVLFYRGIMIAHHSQDRFGLFLATGIVAMLVFHVFINVGMNMGIAPVTGIPLPFISYGGTSLIIALTCVGLLESIALRRQKLQFEG